MSEKNNSTPDSNFLTPNNPFDAKKAKEKEVEVMKITPNRAKVYGDTFKSGYKGIYRPKDDAEKLSEKESKLPEKNEKPASGVHSTLETRTEKHSEIKSLSRTEHHTSGTNHTISALKSQENYTPTRQASVLRDLGSPHQGQPAAGNSFRSTAQSPRAGAQIPPTAVARATPPTSTINRQVVPTASSTTTSTSRFSSPTSSSSSLSSTSGTSKFSSGTNSSLLSSTSSSSSLSSSSTMSSSSASKQTSSLSDKEFKQLRDFLYEKSGIFVNESRKYLFENRLLESLNRLHLSSYSAYVDYLLHKDPQQKELNAFFEKMTTNETSFFRNNPQLDLVRDRVFKKIIEDNAKTKKIRIWSAGCSSGEEPYTISMMLHEILKNDISRWDIKITANDLSPAMLNIAKEATYSEYSLRTTPKNIISSYFTKKGDLYTVNPNVKKLVHFSQINLNESTQTSKVEQSDTIFCRNVMIYFDEDVRRNVLTAFYKNLKDDGVLVIGHSENLYNISDVFKVAQNIGVTFYSKVKK